MLGDELVETIALHDNATPFLSSAALILFLIQVVHHVRRLKYSTIALLEPSITVTRRRASRRLIKTNLASPRELLKAAWALGARNVHANTGRTVLEELPRASEFPNITY
jgi:hypothetical protein